MSQKTASSLCNALSKHKNDGLKNGRTTVLKKDYVGGKVEGTMARGNQGQDKRGDLFDETLASRGLLSDTPLTTVTSVTAFSMQGGAFQRVSRKHPTRTLSTCNFRQIKDKEMRPLHPYNQVAICANF
ncbi:hypothetical protein LOAG_01810 [Loa loa]|uniref:Uncharacterized protein n=1 Tax=Loa loa TaxID=7209 RepID=A0A1I7VYI5_LOALO|nr:hypothetical protein LOAG_01810 [Loa loa]EFO26674.1 hypothetical protein LOAG_01810 [Loa loa]